MLDEQFGLGPLQPYIDDPDVENIDINGPRQVRVTLRDGRRIAGRPVAASDSELMEMVRTWGIREGQTPREFSAARPVLHAALNDAGVRLAAVMSVTPQVHVSIRCHRLVDITLEQLCDPGYGTVSPELAHFLACAVRARKNVIVTGGVDAGKTTLLRALTAALDPDERIATLESEYELYLHLLPARHRDVVPFEARQANSEGAGAITLHDLIPAALRLNPRRIILGEVRDTEIRPMLEAMNSGQEGSMCTLHANSADEVFGRILMLAQRGQLALPPAVIHLEVGMARPFVDPHPQRPRHPPALRQRGDRGAPPGDGDRPDRNRVFSPGPDGRAVPDHSLSPAALDALMAAGFSPAVLERPAMTPGSAARRGRRRHDRRRDRLRHQLRRRAAAANRSRPRRPGGGSWPHGGRSPPGTPSPPSSPGSRCWPSPAGPPPRSPRCPRSSPCPASCPAGPPAPASPGWRPWKPGPGGWPTCWPPAAAWKTPSPTAPPPPRRRSPAPSENWPPACAAARTPRRALRAFADARR